MGLKGGQRIAVPDGGDLKPEFKKIVEEVESGVVSDTSPKSPKKRKNPTRVRSKKYLEAASLVDKTKLYPLPEAVSLVKKTSVTKFDGSVEIHINLNPSVLGEKKDFRGSVTLPHGTGKEVRVAIADDEILAKIESGKIDFDILVAHPSMMPKLAKVARILGPRGLMPNPKTGTVSADPEKRARELSHGQVNFKTEPDQPIIHMSIGKVSFDDKKLMDNITAVLGAIDKNKVTRVTLASTMGPGIKVAIA